MAEVTGLRNNALPYPVYGVPWGVVFPMLDADGDLVTGATTPDAEVSLNGNTFADCTNESTEIATASGVYYLLLTAAEMTADVVTVIAKSATAGMKTTVLTFYPRKLVSMRAGTSASAGSLTSSIILDASASAIDDFYNGMICVAVIDTLTEVRMITDYTGSTQAAAVTPDWNVAPDNNDTFTIYRPDGVQIQQANVTAWNGTIVATPATAGIPDVNVKNAGNTAWGSGAITAASIAADAITAAKVADGTIDAATFAAGAINAAAIASDAITDAKVASDVTIASVTGAVGSVAGAVGSVTGAVGSVTGAVGSVAAGGIAAASFAAGAINAAALATDAVTEIVDAIFAKVVAGSTSLIAAIRGWNAALLGKASGLGTTTAIYRDIADTMPVITATVDANGNRSAVTLDLDDTP